MTIQVSISHRTQYRYDRMVKLSPHLVRLRPAPHCRTPIHSYSLKVSPEQHFINWQQDPFGNYVGRLVFPQATKQLSIEVGLVADMIVINPFDFYLDEYAEHFPFKYTSQLNKDLSPYLEIKERGKHIYKFLNNVDQSKKHIVSFLVDITRQLQNEIGYVVRMEPGVQSCEQTLTKQLGSCRDSAWLLVQLLRHLGLAARFVSGYLVQLSSDIASLDGPSGPSEDFTDLHAWAEVYVPGAGWIGLDATSGLLAGEGHIPLSCTPDPSSASPITGNVDECKVEFSFSNSVSRVHEDPRVTKPYSDTQWQKIYQLGLNVDEVLANNNVNLTLGGEPTFISIDDYDDAQWNTAALGEEKLSKSLDLLQRLHQEFSAQGICFKSQGKWYPGEPLPRWALSTYWRNDDVPLWKQTSLNGLFDYHQRHTIEQTQELIRTIANKLGVDTKHCIPAYEDAVYLRWKQEQDNEALANYATNQPQGYVLPIQKKQRWVSQNWQLAREKLFLIPGDSPMGYRLPLEQININKVDEAATFPLDPFAPRGALPDPVVLNPLMDLSHHQPEINTFIRTALCVELRDGKLFVFLPPQMCLEDWLELIAAIESAAVTTHYQIVLEGYEPPNDPRLSKLQITPDPGVIEVNIHPSSNWQEIVEKTRTIYQQARLARLTSEKFMLDGRHTGTGGGNHMTLGGPNPASSPMLRRPSLLQSLITYWQHHPALSYLFSGTFIGPTSQAPRVDEARDDNLYELEIAFKQLPHADSYHPWIVDRALRNLLTDISGNTHRAEFCIDKLYSPDSATGRLGLLELRAFEMTPHWQMNSIQALLLRNLVAWFWLQPYRKSLIRWGTQLHDRFMLPYFVEQDMMRVVEDLNEQGYHWMYDWFAPFIEFRFPVVGRCKTAQGIVIELRNALETWNVLGEEVSSQGTSRFVDSSVERLQISVSGKFEERYVVICNGHELPLVATDTAGQYVCGVRFKAWQPPSGLHPQIPAQTPLVFDVVDSHNGLSVGGCRYYSGHPGGRNYETFPINANEAEARRSARFSVHGHTIDKLTYQTNKVSKEFSHTLDLRRFHSSAATNIV